LVVALDVMAVLAAERVEVVAQIESLRRDFDGIVAASASSNADDEHDPEGATIAFERAQVSAILLQSESRLAEIDLALNRVTAGTYGVCEQCGEAIAPERLVARPAASLCIGCASLRH
jgi:DnaK suppressor protein